MRLKEKKEIQRHRWDTEKATEKSEIERQGDRGTGRIGRAFILLVM